jgi:hypothetical protein
MRESFLTGQTLPLIIQPGDDERSKAALLNSIRNDRDAFMKKFYNHGAILFRGFDIDTPKDFEDVAMLIDSRMEEGYYGTSPRNLVKGTKHVYTASELPPHYPIMQHCEMSYAKHPPVSLFFYCDVEPMYGGETPLCDFRKVYKEMDPAIREEFDRKGVITVRNYSGLDAKSMFNLFELKKWNEIFLTDDKAEVERQCREQEIEYEWLSNGNLRLQHRTPASMENPVTHEKAWFNHLQVFHPAAAAMEYQHIHHRQQRAKTFFWSVFLGAFVKVKGFTTKPIDQSMNVLFGDGTAVPDSYVKHVEDLIWRHLVIFPWRKNDMLAIDNFSVAHGRLPFEGPRNILAAWSVV